jgi:nitronate monooxygenase
MANAHTFAVITATLRLPVIAAPMFLISGPDLVIAAARAGIIGAFPAPNARTIDDLALWLRVITEALDDDARHRWAVNMIVHASYDRFEAELDLICDARPPLVITALGSPRRPLDRVHAYGGLVFADVISPTQARKAIDAGADGLILVCHGAGGHTGRFNPFAFFDEVRTFWDGPTVVSGAIGSARAIAATRTLGADLAYVGTRFIAARESLVSDDYRQMLVRSSLEDIVTTAAVSGIPANWLRESLERAGFTADVLDKKGQIDFSSLHSDTKAWKTVWGAGQAVGDVRSIQSTQEIVDGLIDDFIALQS